jgi:UDP-N-acetylmuramoylalanine--D-glutamate ligase
MKNIHPIKQYIIYSAIIAFAGGYDKGLSYNDLGKTIAKRVKYLILIGKSADKISESVVKSNKAFPIQMVKNFEDAVKISYRLAIKNDIILLSPACASYDMFNNFEERGLLFKKIVNELLA